MHIPLSTSEQLRWKHITDSDNQFYSVLCRVASLAVSDETEICWKDLADATWIWSGSNLRKRWDGLKQKVSPESTHSHRSS
jgi:hypothetical protein